VPEALEAKHAIVAVRLALTYPEWVLRRVEHVAFLSDTIVRRRESVTIRWPARDFFPEGFRPGFGETIYVPLDLVEKRPLVDVDATRADGSRLPILATGDHDTLAVDGLTTAIWGLSEDTRGAGLGAEAIEAIDAIVTGPPGLGQRLRDRIFDDSAAAPPHDLAEVLDRGDELRGLLRELAGSFLLLVPAVYWPGRETVLKYAYSEPLPWTLSGRSFWARFGLADAKVALTNHWLGYSRSYHVEVAAPAEVELAHARLVGSYVAPHGGRVEVALDADGCKPIVDLHARRPPTAVIESVSSGAQGADDGSWRRQQPPPAEELPSATLVERIRGTEASEVERSDRGIVHVGLRPPVQGTFLAAAVTSLLTALLLIGARMQLRQLNGAVDATLVLTLPLLAAGYLTRPGEHAFATRLLSGTRALVLVVGVCSLAFAAILGSGLIDPIPAPDYRCVPQVAHRLACTARTYSASGHVPGWVANTATTVVVIAVLCTLLLLAGLLRTASAPDSRRERHGG